MDRNKTHRRNGRKSFSSSIEVLERRSLLTAAIAVTTTADSGAGSLRAAVAAAADGDTIDLAAVTGTITLASTIDLNHSVTITGPGQSNLTIRGNNHAVQVSPSIRIRPSPFRD